MTFTAKQQDIIARSRTLMPENFSAYTQDEKILAYAEVILSDINFFPPLTGYTTESIPDNLIPVLLFGVSVFSLLFFQCRASLEDFSYNDNGLTVQVNQVEKIGTAYQNMLNTYKTMIENYKKTEIFNVGGAGLSTPRFQSQIGQFLKISLGASFMWNSPG